MEEELKNEEEKMGKRRSKGKRFEVKNGLPYYDGWIEDKDGNDVLFCFGRAKNYRTSHENTHLTQLFNDEWERIGKKHGVELHYELHTSPKETFVRLDCHVRPYGTPLADVGEEVLQKRRDLYYKINKRKQHAGDRSLYLQKEYLTAADYSEAFEKLFDFIIRTYAAANDAIKSVFAE